MSFFNQNKLDEKQVIHRLASLNLSQESIVQTSSYLTKLCLISDLDTKSSDRVSSLESGAEVDTAAVSRIVKIWHQQVKVICSEPKHTELMFIANDLIQRSAHRAKKQSKSYEFHLEFMHCLPDALQHIFEVSAPNADSCQQVLKLLQVWKTREVYSEAFVTKLEKLVNQTSELLAYSGRIPPEWLGIALILQRIESLERNLKQIEITLEEVMKLFEKNQKGQIDKLDFERLTLEYKQTAEELSRLRLTLLRQRVHDDHLIDKLDNQHILQSLIGLNKVDAAIQTAQKVQQKQK